MTRPTVPVLEAELGPIVAARADGFATVAPRSTDEAAAALGLANRRGWKVRIEGHGTWMPADAPADLAITTRALDRIVSIAPADLVATVQAGASLRVLEAQLASHGGWLAIDPPGAPDRSLGSVLATGTAGPFRHRYGPIRDHVLGTTVATADGRVVKAGGTVVKNVAGYDLSKLQIGGFGGFGLITEVNVRLRALPAARRTLLATGELDPLHHAARALVEADIDAAAIELLSPMATGAPQWRLLVVVAGTEQGTAAEVARASAAAAPVELIGADGAGLDTAVAQVFLEGAVAIRAGALPASLPEIADFTVESLGPGRIALGPGRGGLRWAGDTSTDRLRRYRAALAVREVPVTLERAPWPVRNALGHFGAFREGVAPLTERVRSVFDPARTLVTPLEGVGG